MYLPPRSFTGLFSFGYCFPWKLYTRFCISRISDYILEHINDSSDYPTEDNRDRMVIPMTGVILVVWCSLLAALVCRGGIFATSET